MNKTNESGSRGASAVFIAMIMIVTIAVSGVSGATQAEEAMEFREHADSILNLASSTESFVVSNEPFRFTFEESLPLSIVAWIPQEPSLKVSVLECGSGLDPESNYDTNFNISTVDYLLEEGNIVVGIIPRENSYDGDSQNQEVLRYLDLNSRANDLERVVRFFGFFPDIEIEVVGHSGGGMSAILCAAQIGDSVPQFRNVRIIDMDILYEPGTEEYQNARVCHDASKELLRQGVCIAEDFTAQKELTYVAKIYPYADSGVPRPEPLTGNFTFEGLFYSSLIYTGSFPGVLTSLTSLPSGWGYKQGFFAGEYNFSLNPMNDTYSLTHTNISTVYELLEKISGSGVSPMAFERDMYAVQCGQYPVDLSDIKVNVSLTNTELGFGENDYFVSQMRASGVNVTYKVLEGCAHADLTHADNASEIFYPEIFG